MIYMGKLRFVYLATSSLACRTDVGRKMTLNLKKLEDIVADAEDAVKKYELTHVIHPARLQNKDYPVDKLDWNSIPYEEDKLSVLPDDKRGIYAFGVSVENPILPPHTYILYVGIAGQRSDRSLRERCKDYFVTSKVESRAGVCRMIVKWQKVLRLYYAAVDEDVASEDLEKIEQDVNGALMPPFSRGDFDAKLKAQRSAF